ncbi:MAG TPA: hypothetical protein VF533_12090 [Solirubrobacteraceae bacterium]|jgi:pimeloyl-ACP methyl ester carboxylesterase
MLRLVAAAVAAALLPPLTATAGAAGFAPPDAPGPPLSVSATDLAKVLDCSAGIDGAVRAPVLLFQGTGATAKDNWSWTYSPAFDQAGIPWCTVDLPDHATSDIQRSGEYVVAAIRAVHSRAGRKVSLVGHSQGGMVGRWALRFWPDTRAMVDDVIGFAPSNHGTTEADCSSGCSAAGWQQSDEANFIRAVNSSQETFPGISYTVAYTRTDETVKPNMDATGSSSLRGGGGRIANVAIQDICPDDVNEHLAIGTIDPVAHALAIDALDHDGPADPARVDRLVCARPFHPGVNPATFPADAAAAVASFESYQARQIGAEPPLACYTTASCPAGAGAGAPAPPAAGRACASKRRFAVHLPRRVRRARATVDGRRLKLRRRGGRLTATVDLRGRRKATVVLRVRGRTRSGKRVKYTRRYHPCSTRRAR